MIVIKLVDHIFSITQNHFRIWLTPKNMYDGKTIFFSLRLQADFLMPSYDGPDRHVDTHDVCVYMSLTAF